MNDFNIIVIDDDGSTGVLLVVGQIGISALDSAMQVRQILFVVNAIGYCEIEHFDQIVWYLHATNNIVVLIPNMYTNRAVTFDRYQLLLPTNVNRATLF